MSQRNQQNSDTSHKILQLVEVTVTIPLSMKSMDVTVETSAQNIKIDDSEFFLFGTLKAKSGSGEIVAKVSFYCIFVIYLGML